MLEQKVYLQTSAPLFPNLYTFLVGHPGVGKTRTVMAAGAFLREVPEFHLAPNSMTMASLVDSLLEAKRSIVNMPDPPIEYNSMLIVADELSAFMHKFDEELIGGLTTFYDVTVPYSQRRRGNDIRIKIKRPQLSILSGTTPSNLMKFVPEMAWDQGFTSRVIMIFSDERVISDIFAFQDLGLPKDMIEDLKVINTYVGSFKTTEEFRSAVNAWRKLGQPPVPNHPKLTHYCTRRLAHLLKLSMVASVDRGSSIELTKADFNTAMGWLLEAEGTMPEIFRAGATGADGKVMEEVYHYVQVAVKGLPEHKLVKFVSERVPSYSVIRVIEVMEQSGMIKAVAIDKTGARTWMAIPR